MSYTRKQFKSELDWLGGPVSSVEVVLVLSWEKTPTKQM